MKNFNRLALVVATAISCINCDPDNSSADGGLLGPTKRDPGPGGTGVPDGGGGNGGGGGEERIDWGMLEGVADRTSGLNQPIEITALMYEGGITELVGEGQGLKVEIGAGAPGSKPDNDASWKWEKAFYKEDADGLSAGDHSNDRYRGAIALGAGDHDIAFRVAAKGGPWTYLDRLGDIVDYKPAEAIHVKVSGTPASEIGWAQIHAVSGVENSGAKLRVAVEVYANGVTDKVGAGPGLVAEIGIGARATDPTTAAWSWTSAAFERDIKRDDGSPANDLFTAWLTTPKAGKYDVAVRLSLNGKTIYIDTKWGDGSGDGYKSADAARLDVFAAGTDIAKCNIQYPVSIEGAPGSETVVYGQLEITGKTNTSDTAVLGVSSQVGYGPNASDATTAVGWTFATGIPNAGYDFKNATDEHQATLRLPDTKGTYRYVFRFRENKGWTYCDTNRDNGKFNPAEAGTLDVK